MGNFVVKIICCPLPMFESVRIALGLISTLLRRIGVLWLLAIATAACTQSAFQDDAVKDGVPPLTLKAKISLKYPNPWDTNSLTALSNDGRYLIDASKSARNIRVWDWEKDEVVQRLLLNEGTPERDNKQHDVWGLNTSGGGANLVLSPDGKVVVACVDISTQSPRTLWSAVTARVWNLQSGAIEANIFGAARNVPGYDRDAVFTFKCDVISFSPDGKYMAIASDNGALAANEADVLNFKPNKMPQPIWISGIALYETKNWQLLRFISVPQIKPKQNDKGSVEQKFNSRPLFTEDSKQVLGAVFDVPPLTPKRKYEGEWVGSRIVRWDVESGAMLEEKATPQIGRPDHGVWWHGLPGGREVWWSTFGRTHSHQTQEEAWKCPNAAAPTFVSEVVEDCAYNWALAIMDLETTQIKYLAPFKKNLPRSYKEERELDSLTASISPDGAYLILIKDTSKTNTVPPVEPISIIDVLDRKTLRLEGRYSWKGATGEPHFSSDSKAFTVKTYRRGHSAMFFEMPKKINETIERE